MSKAKVEARQTSKPQCAMSGDEVQAEFNPNNVIKRKIQDAIGRLGPYACRQEEFRQLAGIGSAQLSSVRKDYADYLIPVKENGHDTFLWTGDKEFAAAQRKKLTE